MTNLWLRATDRIKIVVVRFSARSFEELFGCLHWIGKNYLALGAIFNFLKTKIDDPVGFINGAFSSSNNHKKAVDKHRRFVTCPEVVLFRENGRGFDEVSTNVRTGNDNDLIPGLISSNVAIVLKKKGGAPIKENMATTIIELSNWFRISELD